MCDTSWTRITEEARLDISWFLQYATSGNGVSFFGQDSDFFYIEWDACMAGAGGNFSSAYYRWKFDPDFVKKYKSIHRLEAINLLVSYKTLAPSQHPGRLSVVLLTDNMASAYALSTGKTKDAVLGACSRQMWLEAACRDQTFIIQHKPGINIPLADALSRYDVDESKASYADREIARRALTYQEAILDIFPSPPPRS